MGFPLTLEIDSPPMSRIPDIFARLRSEHRSALMPFVTGGYPSLEVTERVLPALGPAGASIIEIGIPFSDPIADGAVIAASMHEALCHGVTPEAIFGLVGGVRVAVSAGLVAMVSHSIVRRMGDERFVKRAALSGFDGLIVPDIDTDGGERSPAGALARATSEQGLTCTFLIAPTTSERRIPSLVALCSGFVYVLARVGITGEREGAPEIADRITLVRRHTDLPVAVGFGISTAEHVAAVTEHADAVIVGSALVRRMGEHADPVEAATTFVSSLADGLREPSVS